MLSDVSHLRAQYRVWLEDEKITTLCTRKDLHGLFKLFKEVLEEMDQLRVTLDDVLPGQLSQLKSVRWTRIRRKRKSNRHWNWSKLDGPIPEAFRFFIARCAPPASYHGNTFASNYQRPWKYPRLTSGAKDRSRTCGLCYYG